MLPALGGRGLRGGSAGAAQETLMEIKKILMAEALSQVADPDPIN